MTRTIPNLAADFSRQLADSVAVGDTTFELNSLLDADGVTLIDQSLYGFTIDSGAKKEYVVAKLDSGTFTEVKSISRQGAVTTGFTKKHRIGVSAQITDHAVLYRVVATLLGITDLDAGVPLTYDGAPVQTDPNAIATVQFVLDTASGGPVSINAQVIAGDAGETVADGEWVYFNTTDGEWYLTDADDAAKCLNVKVGKARGAGTNGNAITGGIFVDGLETVATYVAGTTYYLSNTAGALATSAGTNSVVVGVGDATDNLIFDRELGRLPSVGQKAAMVGGGTFGTPSTLNKFATEDYLVANTPSMVYNTGSATRDVSTASGDQIIAHGMSVAPSRIDFNAVYTSGGTSIISRGTWLSSDYASNTIGLIDGGNDAVDASTAFALLLTSDGHLVARQTCTVVVDATNITLTWTKTGSPSGVTVTFTWAAQGITVFP